MLHTPRPDPPPTTRRASSRRRRLFLACGALVTALGSSWVVMAEPGTSAAARTWYVAVDGDDGGTGYADDPFGSVEQAVRRATDGDTIRIAAGTYRESVQVYEKQLRIVGEGAGTTVLDGARPVDGFVSDGDGRYSAAWSTSFERAQPPHVLPDRPEAGWPEQFFLDGVALVEVPTRDDVGPGTFFHDMSAGRVVLGDDPVGRLVEGSDLGWAVYFNRAHGSSLERLTVTRYATEERHMAAVRAYANDLLVKDVEVTDNARIGLSMMGDRIEARRVVSRDNGYMGLHGHLATDVSVIDSLVVGNNREMFDAWHASAGMKITESQGVEFRGNQVLDNLGPGFWTDLSVRDVVVRENFFRDNMRSGVEIELSSEVIVVDNVMTGNGEQGVWVLESRDVDVWHNYLAGNERAVWVLDGPRADVERVRIGNNVLADPSGERMLLAVDDWTEQRTASDMQVEIDGNRYWASDSTTDFVRWANWPAPLTIADDLGVIRSHAGQEANGTSVRGGSNPYTSAQTALVAIPDHVRAVRAGGSQTSEPDPDPAGANPDTTPATTVAIVPTATVVEPNVASPVPTSTPSSDGDAAISDWTAPAVVRDGVRPVRIGPADESTGSNAPPADGMSPRGSTGAGANPTPTPDAQDWRSFADHLETLLAAG